MMKTLRKFVRWLYWKIDANYDDTILNGLLEERISNELPPYHVEATDGATEQHISTDDELGAGIHKLVRAYLFDGDETTARRLLEAESVICQVTGYVDGMACLNGVDEAVRSDVRETALYYGRVSALQAHDRQCEGCITGNTLREEVYPTQN